MATTPRRRGSDHEFKASELEAYREHDATLDHMIKHHIRLTRENYINMAYGGAPPKHWGAERESMLPEPFQHARDD